MAEDGDGGGLAAPTLGLESRDDFERKHGFTFDDMEICIKVLNCLRTIDGWADNPRFKQLRTAGM